VLFFVTACARLSGPSDAAIRALVDLDSAQMGSVAPDTFSTANRSLSLSPAERENGVSAKYGVHWTGVGHRHGVAEDLSGDLLFVKVPEGWLAGAGSFPSANDFVGRDGYLMNEKGDLIGDGDYAGSFKADDHYAGQHETCVLTLARTPTGAFSGTYAFSGSGGSTTPKFELANVIAFVHPSPRNLLWYQQYGHDWRIYAPRTTHGVLLVRDEAKVLHSLALTFHEGLPGFDVMWDLWSPSNVLRFEPVRRGPAAQQRPTTQPASTDTTYQPASTDTTSSPPTPPTSGTSPTAAADLPGHPYPNPPSDAETREAINAFMGEDMDGRQRVIEILGYRKLCAEPVGPECYVVIDGKRHKAFTLERKSDGRLEATDLGSCGD
jgi:hypothetical protein